MTIEVLAGGPTPLAPVAWAVHDGPNPFVVGQMGRLEGPESLAEDGDPTAVAAVHGTVTSSVQLYDAGTEMNEAPGMGANQAPRQSGANIGMMEDQPVMAISEIMDGYGYPGVETLINVTISTAASM